MSNTSRDAATLVKSGLLVLRKARADDAEALSRFGARTFSDTFAAENTPSDMAAYLADAFGPAKQLREISDPASSVTLAVHRDGSGDGLAGYTHLVEEDDSVLLKRIYVDQAWQGSGLGRLLLDDAKRECGRRGRTRLWLTVWERNPRAIAFYRKLGFRVSGMTRFQLGDDLQTDFVMEIDVAD